MAKMDVETARSLFTYEAATGLLRWKISPSFGIKIGAVAGTKAKLGYIRVMHQQKSYMAHCIAWAIVHGEWPHAEIDHRDRVRDNNRLDNLRLATRVQNSMNQWTGKKNTSGFKGISFAKKKGKWWARITVEGRRRSLGLFDSAEEAAQVYQAAQALHHGEWGVYQ